MDYKQRSIKIRKMLSELVVNESVSLSPWNNAIWRIYTHDDYSAHIVSIHIRTNEACTIDAIVWKAESPTLTKRHTSLLLKCKTMALLHNAEFKQAYTQEFTKDES